MFTSANLVGELKFTIFHFSVSFGTFVYQLGLFALLFSIEIYGFKKTQQLIWIVGVVNFVFAIFVHYIIKLPIPDFWVKLELANEQVWKQFTIILMLNLGFVCAGIAMLICAGYLRTILGRQWLFIRMSVPMLVALACDVIVVGPILYFIAGDNYMAGWHLISLVSVKIYLIFLALPITYILIKLFRFHFMVPYKRRC